MRSVTQRGLDAIVRFEGLRLTAYRDSAGLPTIGVGHLLTRSELASGKIRIGDEAVKWRGGITEAQAYAILEEDLDQAEEAVERLAPGLPDHRFDVLVSLTFNIGVRALEQSTLLKHIHKGHMDAVPAQILRWNRAGGVVVAGLVNRRRSEAASWA